MSATLVFKRKSVNYILGPAWMVKWRILNTCIVRDDCKVAR
jgi:hypothetical protein